MKADLKAIAGSPYISLFFSFTAGLSCTFAFAPYYLWPLAVLCPAGLFILVSRTTSARQAFNYGLIFGLGYFSFGLLWLYHAIQFYGHLPPLIAITILGSLILYLSLYPALIVYLWRRYVCYKGWLHWLLITPLLWTAGSWLRSILFTGMTWLQLGHTQTASPLASYAPILGGFGLTGLVIVQSTLLAGSYVKRLSRTSCIAILFTFSFLYLSTTPLAQIAWTQPLPTATSVSLVQANIAQQNKWHPGLLHLILRRYLQLSQHHWSEHTVIWPESALPTLSWRISPTLAALEKAAKGQQATLITGILEQDTDVHHAYNALLTLGHAGEQHYHKRHLVPFGEYPPLASLLTPLLDKLHIPMSQLTLGAEDQPQLQLGQLRVAPFICYEITDQYLVLSHAAQANALLVITDDSWFASMSTVLQHLQMAQLRALETAKPVLFSSNTGYSAVIDYHGHLQAIAPYGMAFTLDTRLVGRRGTTPIAYLAR